MKKVILELSDSEYYRLSLLAIQKRKSFKDLLLESIRKELNNEELLQIEGEDYDKQYRKL